MKIASIINARVNSTRVPRKMVRPFAGTTLLDIALEKMQSLRCQKKYLAACEPEILEIASKYDGIEILHRDSNSVAKGKREQSETFAHYKDIDASHLLMINPCFPFANNSTYEFAMTAFYKSSWTTMTSVKRRDNIFFTHDHGLINHTKDVSTQGQEPIYEMAHMFHIFDLSYFLNEGTFWDYSDGHPGIYEIEDPKQCLDIDTPLEFEMCELLYSSKNSGGKNSGD